MAPFEERVEVIGTVATSPGPQASMITTLCTAVTAQTPQTGVSVDGYNGAQMAECIAVGTVAAQAVTFKIQGSYDNVNFYDVGYQQVDGVAAPTRSVSGFTQTPGNGTVRNVLQIIDPYKFLRVNPSANTLLTGLTVKVYGVPV